MSTINLKTSSLISAYHALRTTIPDLGRPKYQTAYDLLFLEIQQFQSTLPEDSDEARMLSDIEADYVQQLTATLSKRDDETFRTDSYYWLTLLSEGYTSPHFTDLLSKEAEQRLFSDYGKVKTVHRAPGCRLPSMEALWLLNVQIAMQLNPRHQYSIEAECLDLAKENLHLLKDIEDPDGNNTQLLALLHLRTGDDTYRQLAQAAIATWPSDELTLQQKYFLQYYKSLGLKVERL